MLKPLELPVADFGWEGKHIANTVHPLIRSWDANSATWELASVTATWANPGRADYDLIDFMSYAAGGGDWDSTSEALEVIDGDWETYDVTTMVQAMIDTPADNHGFLFRGGPEIAPTEGRDYYSSDAATEANRPKLVVEYGVTPVGRQLARSDAKLSNLRQDAQGITVALQASGSYTINIIDVRGRLISTTSSQGLRNVAISTQTLSRGVYTVQIVGKTQYQTTTISIR